MIAEHFKLNSRVRNVNRSVSMFVAELRKLKVYCEYGDSLKDMLSRRDYSVVVIMEETNSSC